MLLCFTYFEDVWWYLKKIQHSTNQKLCQINSFKTFPHYLQVKQRLVSHLASCVSGLQQISPFSAPSSITTSHNSSPEDVNNNSSASARLQMMTGLQLIPSRLPTGELALLLPNSQHLPFFPAPLDNQVSTTTESPTTSVPSNPGHNSAFRAVSKDKFYSRSPLPSPTSTTASSFGDDSCDRPYPSPNLLPEVSSTSESLKSVDSSLKFNRTESQSLLQIAPPQFTNLNSNLDHHHQSRFQSTVKPIHSPLTVITSNKMLREIPQKMEKPNLSSFKNPLDFSLKKDAFTVNFPKPLKRPIQDDDSNMIKSSDFQPPLKMAKLFTENPPQNIAQSARRHFYEIQNHDPKTFQSSFEINQSTSERNCIVQNSNQPSTSSSEVPRDMWRPW